MEVGLRSSLFDRRCCCRRRTRSVVTPLLTYGDEGAGDFVKHHYTPCFGDSCLGASRSRINSRVRGKLAYPGEKPS